MKDALKKAAAALGLEKPARRLWWQFKAHGWTEWTPLVPEAAFMDCVRRAIGKLREVESGKELGAYLEFGVSRGTSMSCVHRVLMEEGLDDVRLIGFDSFEGLPAEAAEEGWKEGDYSSTIDATRRYLASHGVDLGRVSLVKGWFKDTLNQETRKNVAIGKTSLIMIDCDIYSASKEALNFSAQHIEEHAVVIFDDWGWREQAGEVGQREAFSEFLAEYPGIEAKPLPSYRPEARVFLLKRRLHRGERASPANSRSSP